MDGMIEAVREALKKGDCPHPSHLGYAIFELYVMAEALRYDVADLQATVRDLEAR